jgi:hypothetical protein
MNIKKINKLAGGVSLLEPLMVIALFAMMIIMAIIYYSASTKRFNPDFMDIISFANNLNSLQSDKEVITLKYNEITPFQKDLFSKIDCVHSICKTIDLQKYPPNTYLRIYYKDSKFDSFYLYTKKNSSIFNFNTTVYNDWVSNISFDRFKEEEITLIKREKKRYPDMNPFITYLSNTFDNVSIYNISDNDQSLVKDDNCPEANCTSVLAYKNNPIVQLADNKKAL